MTITPAAPVSEPPVREIAVPGRASAQNSDEFAAHAARYTVTVDGEAKAGNRSLLRLELVGDTASSLFEGREEDVFWDGSAWDIDITPAQDTDRRVVEVAVYPLTADTPVWLPKEADRIKATLQEPTAEILTASVVTFRAMQVETR